MPPRPVVVSVVLVVGVVLVEVLVVGDDVVGVLGVDDVVFVRPSVVDGDCVGVVLVATELAVCPGTELLPAGGAPDEADCLTAVALWCLRPAKRPAPAGAARARDNRLGNS